MENEIWKDVVGYEGLYMVSSLGRVKSIKSVEKIRIPQRRNKNGLYFAIDFYKNAKQKNIQIHRLVAIAFLPNPENKKCVNHIDNNPSNNCVSNLEWATYKENVNHALKQGRHPVNNLKKPKPTKLKEKDILEIRNSNFKQSVLAKKYNVSQATISFVKNEKRWKHI